MAGACALPSAEATPAPKSHVRRENLAGSRSRGRTNEPTAHHVRNQQRWNHGIDRTDLISHHPQDMIALTQLNYSCQLARILRSKLWQEHGQPTSARKPLNQLDVIGLLHGTSSIGNMLLCMYKLLRSSFLFTSTTMIFYMVIDPQNKIDIYTTQHDSTQRK